MRLFELLADKPGRVVTLPPSATVMEASTLMREERVGAVMVVDRSARFLGIVSERDLALEIASSGARLFRRRLFEVMRSGGPTTRS